MSANVPRELMILVERVVRPLPIPLGRKKRLRAEFLQHLQTTYAEELARDGDSAAALARAAERFGDPNTLTAELRRTVHRRERYEHWFEGWTAQRPEESVSRFAMRLLLRTIQLEMLGICLAVLMMLDHHFFGTERLSWQGFAALFAVWTFLTVWMAGLLMFGLHLGAEIERPTRHWPKIGLLAAALFATWPCSLKIMFLLASGSWSEHPTWYATSVFGGVFVLLLGTTFGVFHHRDTVYRRQWDALDLNAR